MNKKQSKLFREAIDYWIEQKDAEQRHAVLKQTAGMWKDRCDLVDFDKMRKDWDKR